MPPPVPEQLSRTIETLYRSESGRVLATLVRLLGYLDLAEESMHEAFAAAFVLEARDMNHAVQLMAQHPAMTYGNIFEIRPAGGHERNHQGKRAATETKHCTLKAA